MPTLLATFISLLTLATALPAPSVSIYNGTTYPLGTSLSFKQTSYPYTNNLYLSANISAVSTEPGACYPHSVQTTYIAGGEDLLLNLTTTSKTKANGHTAVNHVDVGGDCWGLLIESGILTVRQGVQMEGFYVLDGVLMNNKAPYGFYYCYDSNGNGIIGVEDKKMTHAGGIYSICFTTTFTAFETSS